MLVDHRRRTKIVDSFYKQVVGLSQPRIRLLWIGKSLQGELRVLPVTAASETAVLEHISQNIGAIGFVSAERFDSSRTMVKAVRIDGEDFRSKEYPIR